MGTAGSGRFQGHLGAVVTLSAAEAEPSGWHAVGGTAVAASGARESSGPACAAPPSPWRPPWPGTPRWGDWRGSILIRGTPGVAQRRLAGHDRGKIAADHLGQADLVEHVPDVGPDRHPDVAERLRVAGVGQLVRAVVAHPGERPVDDPDDVTQGDGARVPRQLEAAPDPPMADDQPLLLELGKDVLEEFERDVLDSPMCSALTVPGPWAASSIAARTA